MSVSNYISNEGVIQLTNACNFAEDQGTPLTMFATIAWSKTIGWSEVTHSARQTTLFSKLSDWMSWHKLPTVYVSVLEKSNRIGLHQNLAIYVPKPLFGKLLKALPGMIPGYVPDTHTLAVLGDTDGPPKFYWHVNQRRGSLRYYLKGMDHTATFTNSAGDTVNLADWIGIEHRGQQGTIIGKRFTVSQSLGRAARRRAGYEDRTSPDGLRALLGPVMPL